MLRRAALASPRLMPAQRGFSTSGSKVGGGELTFVNRTSRWGYKFKDHLHFCILLTALPLGILITAVNIFVGPAELTPIPEGYNPKEEEYYRHPISRFLVRNFRESEQERYEKFLFCVWENEKTSRMKQLELLRSIRSS